MFFKPDRICRFDWLDQDPIVYPVQFKEKFTSGQNLVKPERSLPTGQISPATYDPKDEV